MSIILSSSKIQNGAILVLAYPGCPGKMAIKRELWCPRPHRVGTLCNDDRCLSLLLSVCDVPDPKSRTEVKIVRPVTPFRGQKVKGQDPWAFKVQNFGTCCCHVANILSHRLQLSSVLCVTESSPAWDFIQFYCVLVINQIVSSCVYVKCGFVHVCVLCIVDDSDSDTDVPRGKVLAAVLSLVPGHFSCDAVWQTHFVLHPRLKSTGTSSAPRSSSSPGQQTASHSADQSADLIGMK